MRAGRILIGSTEPGLYLHSQGPSSLPDYLATFRYYFGMPRKILSDLERCAPTILPVSSRGARVIIEGLTFEGRAS